MAKTAGMATVLRLTPDQITQALANLHPSISALLVGLHGIGKSQIAQGIQGILKERYPEHEWPTFDRRLAQMTEGDLIGIPHIKMMEKEGVVCFLPTDWWKQACDEPCIVVLDELNRAEIQMMNGGFQIVGARELNGMKLHPMTRVISCVNPPEHYQVQEMDKALVDRFFVFHMKHDANSWLKWARGRLDDAIVDFIQENPSHLHHDVAKTQDLEVAPTPRSWEKLDTALTYARIPAGDCQGRPAPDLLTYYANAAVGQGAAVALCKWLRDRASFLSVEDILDNWEKPSVQKLAQRLRHEEILGSLDRLGQDCKGRTWTPKQSKNLIAFAMAPNVLSGEDRVLLFTKITQAGRMDNILSIHNSEFTDAVVNSTNEADRLG